MSITPPTPSTRSLSIIFASEFNNSMHCQESNISKFYITGINYKKTDASIRGEFSISKEQYENILAVAPKIGVTELFILSTCNRTEIYGFVDDASKLIDLLCTQTAGNVDTFKQLCYIKQGTDAINHLFTVAAGLDSQILGDYEIVGQIKVAVAIAKQKGFIGGFTERLVNNVLQSTKNIKNQTVLSGGTVSVSFAAIQYIKKTLGCIKDKKILLLGVGKIGSNTSKNLVNYLHTTNITLINRTEEKASELAQALGLKHASYHEMPAYIQSSDIILVATGADEPTLLKSHLEGFGKKLIIDLSIPYNVEKRIKELSDITLVNVDELSKIQDETLQKRVAEVPKARKIISQHIAEFLAWIEMRRNITVIKAAKEKLSAMQRNYALRDSNDLQANSAKPDFKDHAVEKAVKSMAVKMRAGSQPGCIYIEALNHFLMTSVSFEPAKLSA